MSSSNVSIIGSGNLAWHLAPALDNAGFVIKEVYSRNPRHAEALTERLYQAEVKASLDFSTKGCEMLLLQIIVPIAPIIAILKFKLITKKFAYRYPS